MMCLWKDRPDPANMAAHAGAIFRFVLPSLPMFLVIPLLLRQGFGFGGSLAAGCALTIVVYGAMTWTRARFGMRL